MHGNHNIYLYKIRFFLFKFTRTESWKYKKWQKVQRAIWNPLLAKKWLVTSSTPFYYIIFENNKDIRSYTVIVLPFYFPLNFTFFHSIIYSYLASKYIHILQKMSSILNSAELIDISLKTRRACAFNSFTESFHRVFSPLNLNRLDRIGASSIGIVFYRGNVRYQVGAEIGRGGRA